MGKFIGPTGLIYLWAKIKKYVGDTITALNLGDTYQAKESGKGLSTNDYTTAEKNKLSGIAAGAEVNVQSNWAESNSSSDAYIQNKPSIPSKTSDLTNDSGYITSADVPEGSSASTTMPVMDGTAARGTDDGFARGDHVHPTDTSRQAAITSSNKLSADLISDGTTNKTVTDTEKTTWSGKQDALVSGTNIKTINNESILGSGNITVSGGGGGSGEANVIESISINGTAQAVTSKNVDLAVPVSSTITAIVTLTEAQYTDLSTKDSSTLYIITA